MSTLRQCPVCPNTDLSTKTTRGFEVDICQECSGIWFDAGEFDPLVAERFRGEEMEAFFDDAVSLPESCRYCGAEARGGVVCPACGEYLAIACPVDGDAMHIVLFDELELDRCPCCHGIWIDGRERAELSGRTSPRLAQYDEESEAEQIVFCSSCGAELPRRHCIRRMDAYWCEGCVVEGDYPGGHGPPVARRLAEAAQSMAEAKSNLERRKARNADIKRARQRTIMTGRGQYRHAGETYYAVVDAIETAARSIKNLFSRKKNGPSR